MPSNTQITVSQLLRLVGLPGAPAIIDVRLPEDAGADTRMLPASTCRSHDDVQAWAPALRGKRTVVVCQKGRKLSEGVAAWLRHLGIAAETLEGGFEAWRAGGGLLFNTDTPLRRNGSGNTFWVTRARPKVDRVACPWLIRRFIDPGAVFLFVDAGEVEAVAERFGAAPFDIAGVFWSHRGDGCTFDTMIDTFGLASPALAHLAAIVRAADTARLELAPQAAGLLAASLGFSRMYRDDLEQIEAAMPLYDAFYRWCRDALGETHSWPGHAKSA